MSKPVYLLLMLQGFTEAFYQLSKEEQANLWSKWVEVDQNVGAKWLIDCDSRWADEAIFGWGVLEYPDMEAYQKKVVELEKLGIYRYYLTKTILGTKTGE